MELFGIVIVVVLVAMYYGLFDSVEEAADMAKDELKDARRDQKVRLATKAGKRTITAEIIAKATESNTLLDSYDLN
jgi:hypothetical protein